MLRVTRRNGQYLLLTALLTALLTGLSACTVIAVTTSVVGAGVSVASTAVGGVVAVGKGVGGAVIGK